MVFQHEGFQLGELRREELEADAELLRALDAALDPVVRNDARYLDAGRKAAPDFL